MAAFLSRRFKLGASSFAPRTQYIHVAQLEVLAALAVYMSLPSWLAGRRVLHFIDNQGALSNLISCSSKDLDCAWMVHDFAIRAARLSCGVWFDYVRSKANLASRAGSCFWAWAAWRCSRQCLSAAAGLRSRDLGHRLSRPCGSTQMACFALPSLLPPNPRPPLTVCAVRGRSARGRAIIRRSGDDHTQPERCTHGGWHCQSTGGNAYDNSNSHILLLL